MKNLDIWSILSATSGEPFVQFKFDEEHKFQLSPQEARDHAAKIMEVAFAAEADAFLVDYLTNKLHMEMGTAIALLNEFRQWREGKHSKTDQMRWKSFEEQKGKP